VISETERYAIDESNYQYYEWVKNLTIPAVEMTDDTSYRCTVRSGRLSNYADYSFTVVGKLLFVVLGLLAHMLSVVLFTFSVL